jgi:hypothetical protein
MFRPRLRKSEIRLLLDLLNREKENVKQQLEQIEVLKRQVYRIKKEAYLNPYVVIQKGYLKKKQELQALESQLLTLTRYVHVYDGLTVRFQDLLDGKRKGRLKWPSQFAQLNLSIIEGTKNT